MNIKTPSIRACGLTSAMQLSRHCGFCRMAPSNLAACQKSHCSLSACVKHYPSQSNPLDSRGSSPQTPSITQEPPMALQILALLKTLPPTRPYLVGCAAEPLMQMVAMVAFIQGSCMEVSR